MEKAKNKLNLLFRIKNKLLADGLKFYIESSVLKDKFELQIDLIPQESRNYEIVVFDKSGLKESKPEEFSSKKLLLDDGSLEEETIFLFLYYKLSGVLSPDTSLSLFIKCIEVVLKGEVWISNNLMKKLCENYDEFSTKKNLGLLTPKERRIMELIFEGLSNKEIALRLSISEKTVKAHINHIFKKTGTKNRTQLIKYFYSSGSSLSSQVPQPIKKTIKFKKS